VTNRICIVIDAHLSTCPRMLKAADSLAGAGYAVRVVSTSTAPWATRTDQEIARDRADSWRWHVVDQARESDRLRWAAAGARMRAASAASRAFGPNRLPMSLIAPAQCRPFPTLVRATAAEPVDLVYGGTGRGLAAAAAAARRLGVPYALDLEDFHSAESEATPDGRLRNALAARIERVVLPGAAFLTAGSAAIADAYESTYGVQPIPINNTFPLPSQAPTFDVDSATGLRLYWFSQTIGPGRGLEDAIRAVGLAGVTATLTLRGGVASAYLRTLRELASAVAPRATLVHQEPTSPDAMIDVARAHDIGLALELRTPLNRDLCLTNKAFTYLLAGLAVIFTDTTGQRRLAHDLGPAAFTFAQGDVRALAERLAFWASNPDALRAARAAAWSAARRRWHWEHDEERGALLRAVERALHVRDDTRSAPAA